MSARVLTPEALTAAAFAPYGDVIEVAGAPDRLINRGKVGRFHDRARIDFGPGRAGISVMDAEARPFPHRVDMVERHPLGSQAFIPITGVRLLVVVADDDGGRPVNLRAFVSQPGQSVNLLRGTWHGVLTPIGTAGQFVVVDHIGDGQNLEEHWFDEVFVVETA